jgi:hypothetical protein
VSTDTKTYNVSPSLDESTSASILLASQIAYDSLVENDGYNPEEVHRLAVCYQASALIASHLFENGYYAEHEIRSGWTVTEHSYVTIDVGLNTEIVIDPTWQQFLPKDKVSERMPKVLVGTRDEIISQAQRFGVDEFTLKLWRKQEIKMTVYQQKHVDNEAKEAADHAEEDGAWERFMAPSS